MPVEERQICRNMDWLLRERFLCLIKDGSRAIAKEWTSRETSRWDLGAGKTRQIIVEECRITRFMRTVEKMQNDYCSQADSSRWNDELFGEVEIVFKRK